MKNIAKEIPPFQLVVEPLPNAAYKLIVLQRPFPVVQDGRVLPFMKMDSIDGLALSSTWDLVLDTLRSNHYKPTVMQPGKSTCLALSETSGVRLALLCKVIAPLSNLNYIRTLQQAIWMVSDEEAYYWFAKCCGPKGCRGVRAFRLLHGPVLLNEAEWLQVIAE